MSVCRDQNKSQVYFKALWFRWRLFMDEVSSNLQGWVKAGPSCPEGQVRAWKWQIFLWRKDRERETGSSALFFIFIVMRTECSAALLPAGERSKKVCIVKHYWSSWNSSFSISGKSALSFVSFSSGSCLYHFVLIVGCFSSDCNFSLLISESVKSLCPHCEHLWALPWGWKQLYSILTVYFEIDKVGTPGPLWTCLSLLLSVSLNDALLSSLSLPLPHCHALHFLPSYWGLQGSFFCSTYLGLQWERSHVFFIAQLIYSVSTCVQMSASLNQRQPS